MHAGRASYSGLIVRLNRSRRDIDRRLVALLALAVFSIGYLSRSAASGCAVSLGAYHGPTFRSASTVDAACLVESPWLRVMQHTVRVSPTSTVDDWLFIDYHDRINVLVEGDDGDSPSGSLGALMAPRSFYVFRQKKYALEEESYAIVGGIVEPGEDSAVAAAREVREEMGLDCANMVPLGRYRTDVNRGMGWVNSFAARDCRHISAGKAQKTSANAEEVGAADVERQDIVKVSLDELKEAALSGQFVEVQWSNTVSLALLHYQAHV